MKVKDLSQPLLSGRMGNLIYYVRNGVQCVRRAEVPGKKRKKERSDQQRRGECVPGPCTHRPSSHESG